MARLVVIAAAAAALFPASARAGVAFAPAQTYGVGPQPVQVVTADFNGDGLLDLATVNDNAIAGSQITVLSNDGAGFTATGIPGVDNAQSLAAGDVSGDGRADLVVANNASADGTDGYAVFVNQGDGTFEAPAFHDIADGDNPWGVALVDARGIRSGLNFGLDVVVTGTEHGGSAGRVTAFLNDGQGTLAEQPAVPTGSSPRGITSLDIDGDFLSDLFVANGGTNAGVSELLDVAGVFAPVATVGLPGAGDVRWLGAGDLTGDQVPEAVVPSPATDQIYVLAGAAGGALATSGAAHAAGDAPVAAVVHDLDRDGRNDVAVASSGSTNGVTLLLGSEAGALAGAGSLAAGVANGSPRSLVVADLNRDGYADIAAADTSAGKVSVYYAIPPAVDMATAVDFGDVILGNSAFQSIAVTNHGPQTLFLPAPVDLTGRDQADYKMESTCGSSLAPGASCEINLTFTPGARGERLAFAQLTTTGRGPDVVALTGRGAIAPVLPPQLEGQAVLGARQPAVLRCVVPNLRGKTLKAARKLLKKGRCRLGKVKKARISKKAKARIKAKVKSKRYKATTVIYKQSPKAKKRVARNAKVAVTVRTKLKKVRRSAKKR